LNLLSKPADDLFFVGLHFLDVFEFKLWVFFGGSRLFVLVLQRESTSKFEVVINGYHQFCIATEEMRDDIGAKRGFQIY
jgi:hypothetical protein